MTLKQPVTGTRSGNCAVSGTPERFRANLVVTSQDGKEMTVPVIITVTEKGEIVITPTNEDIRVVPESYPGAVAQEQPDGENVTGLPGYQEISAYFSDSAALAELVTDDNRMVLMLSTDTGILPGTDGGTSLITDTALADAQPAGFGLMSFGETASENSDATAVTVDSTGSGEKTGFSVLNMDTFNGSIQENNDIIVSENQVIPDTDNTGKSVMNQSTETDRSFTTFNNPEIQNATIFTGDSGDTGIITRDGMFFGNQGSATGASGISTEKPTPVLVLRTGSGDIPVILNNNGAAASDNTAVTMLADLIDSGALVEIILGNNRPDDSENMTVIEEQTGEKSVDPLIFANLAGDERVSLTDTNSEPDNTVFVMGGRNKNIHLMSGISGSDTIADITVEDAPAQPAENTQADVTAAAPDFSGNIQSNAKRLPGGFETVSITTDAYYTPLNTSTNPPEAEINLSGSSVMTSVEINNSPENEETVAVMISRVSGTDSDTGQPTELQDGKSGYVVKPLITLNVTDASPADNRMNPVTVNADNHKTGIDGIRLREAASEGITTETGTDGTVESDTEIPVRESTVSVNDGVSSASEPEDTSVNNRVKTVGIRITRPAGSSRFHVSDSESDLQGMMSSDEGAFPVLSENGNGTSLLTQVDSSRAGRIIVREGTVRTSGELNNVMSADGEKTTVREPVKTGGSFAAESITAAQQNDTGASGVMTSGSVQGDSEFNQIVSSQGTAGLSVQTTDQVDENSTRRESITTQTGEGTFSETSGAGMAAETGESVEGAARKDMKTTATITVTPVKHERIRSDATEATDVSPSKQTMMNGSEISDLSGSVSGTEKPDDQGNSSLSFQGIAVDHKTGHSTGKYHTGARFENTTEQAGAVNGTGVEADGGSPGNTNGGPMGGQAKSTAQTTGTEVIFDFSQENVSVSTNDSANGDDTASGGIIRNDMQSEFVSLSKPGSAQSVMPRWNAFSPETESKIMNTVIQNARFMIANGHSSAEIRLEPPNLGKMKLDIVTENSKVTGKITVESHEIKEIIQNNLSGLKDQLAQSGLKVESFDVQVGHNSGADAWANRQNAENMNFNLRRNANTSVTGTAEKYDVTGGETVLRGKSMNSDYLDLWM
ncbi:flagellar hook-length control protein FliK [bacterium]|nr:flagellar hook-length control protein FliK [bacterium]